MPGDYSGCHTCQSLTRACRLPQAAWRFESWAHVCVSAIESGTCTLAAALDRHMSEVVYQCMLEISFDSLLLADVSDLHVLVSAIDQRMLGVVSD